MTVLPSGVTQIKSSGDASRPNLLGLATNRGIAGPWTTLVPGEGRNPLDFQIVKIPVICRNLFARHGLQPTQENVPALRSVRLHQRTEVSFLRRRFGFC